MPLFISGSSEKDPEGSSPPVESLVSRGSWSTGRSDCEPDAEPEPDPEYDNSVV